MLLYVGSTHCSFACKRVVAWELWDAVALFVRIRRVIGHILVVRNVVSMAL